MQLVQSGPVGFRQFFLEKACQSNVGHTHNYDHATFIHRGRVKIIIRDASNNVISQLEHSAGEWVYIKAELHHEIKALEDNTCYYCVFSHRDFDGLVSQAYVGNMGAYQ
jgi:quercetin dioxygenase-like cupin family protein